MDRDHHVVRRQRHRLVFSSRGRRSASWLTSRRVRGSRPCITCRITEPTVARPAPAGRLDLLGGELVLALPGMDLLAVQARGVATGDRGQHDAVLVGVEQRDRRRLVARSAHRRRHSARASGTRSRRRAAPLRARRAAGRAGSAICSTRWCSPANACWRSAACATGRSSRSHRARPSARPRCRRTRKRAPPQSTAMTRERRRQGAMPAIDQSFTARQRSPEHPRRGSALETASVPRLVVVGLLLAGTFATGHLDRHRRPDRRVRASGSRRLGCLTLRDRGSRCGSLDRLTTGASIRTVTLTLNSSFSPWLVKATVNGWPLTKSGGSARGSSVTLP